MTDKDYTISMINPPPLAIREINYLNNYIKALHQDIKDLKFENQQLRTKLYEKELEE